MALAWYIGMLRTTKWSEASRVEANLQMCSHSATLLLSSHLLIDLYLFCLRSSHVLLLAFTVFAR